MLQSMGSQRVRHNGAAELNGGSDRPSSTATNLPHTHIFDHSHGKTCSKGLLLLSHFSCVQLCATPRRQPTRLPCPWDSPGKNSGVGCHFLLQGIKVKSESEAIQSCPTLHDLMDYSLPGSLIPRILQARVLEWGAIAFSMRA